MVPVRGKPLTLKCTSVYTERCSSQLSSVGFHSANIQKTTNDNNTALSPQHSTACDGCYPPPSAVNLPSALQSIVQSGVSGRWAPPPPLHLPMGAPCQTQALRSAPAGIPPSSHTELLPVGPLCFLPYSWKRPRMHPVGLSGQKKICGLETQAVWKRNHQQEQHNSHWICPLLCFPVIVRRIFHVALNTTQFSQTLPIFKRLGAHTNQFVLVYFRWDEATERRRITHLTAASEGSAEICHILHQPLVQTLTRVPWLWGRKNWWGKQTCTTNSSLLLASLRNKERSCEEVLTLTVS